MTTNPVAIGSYFFSRYKKETLGIFLGMLFASVTEGLGIMSLVLAIQVMLNADLTEAPVPVLFILERIEEIGLSPDFISVLVIIASLIVLKAILLMFAETYAVRVNTRIASDLRLELIDKIIHANWGFFTSNRLGKFSNSLNQESTTAAGIYLVFCRAASHVSNLFIYIIVAAALSWELALAALIASMVLLRLMRRFVTMSAKAAAGQATANKQMISVFTDGLLGMKTLKAMGLEDNLIATLKIEVDQLMRAHYRAGFAKVMIKHAREPFMTILLTFAILSFVNLEGSFERIDVGVLVGMMLIFQRAVNGAGHLQGTYQDLVSKEPFFSSLRGILDSADANQEHPALPGDQVELVGGIYFKKVTRYFEDNKNVLTDITVAFPAGSLTVVNGDSGSGKTTLADMMCGLLMPSRGEIFIGPTQLSQRNLSQWRKQVGYIEQEPFLFHDSIRNNICVGQACFEESDVTEALVKAGCWNFVSSLPEGIDSVVGERGTKLSGGQRQRITIARALIRKPTFLILDEATNGLDQETEAEIIETLYSLRGSVTILFISHKPTILAVADQVIHIEGGRVRTH